MGDWKKARLSRIRALIKAADPKVTEEIKYRKPTNPAGVPVWYQGGMICTGETYKTHLRLTFAKGYSLKDPKKLLSQRSITIHESDKLNEAAFKALIKEAIEVNGGNKKTASMKGLREGAKCNVIAGTHTGKSGMVRDINTSATGAVTITVLQKSGVRFKTLAKNIEIIR